MNRLIKRLFKTVISITILTAACLCGAAYWGYQQIHAPLNLTQPQTYDIRSGASLSGVANDLQRQGIINSAKIMRLATRLKPYSATIRAGEYRLTPDMTVAQTLKLFQKGSNVQHLITFKEGLTSYEIVQRLNAQEGLKGDITAIPPEGTLLPETYSYQKGATRQSIINRMQIAHETALNTIWESRAHDLPFTTKQEAVTLASIIEKETAVPSERARVSGVFINRLRKNMLLQTDPTVIYAITGGKHQNNGKGPLGRRLLRKDLKTDSPYNTYKYKGLPPAPIANVGIESLKAAVNPETHNYLFFVANGKGGHTFSKTLNGHNQAVAMWRKVRDQ